jgi:CheY-like chemotaxis protein
MSQWASHQQPKGPSSESVGTKCKAAYNTGKILIVDDEKFNCEIIDGFLMLLNFQNKNKLREFAYNGEQAIDAVKNAISDNDPHRYALILMDCNMPFKDGYQATKEIRKLYKTMGVNRNLQPKIVAVTGHVENEYV